MKNTLNYLSNKAICAALVVLGAFAASAELVKTPILDAENVSVGYKVTGLENDEVAMVYTNHLRTATWTVPATLNNVQFLVVGGGGGGGGGLAGPGGGGGGVVTGFVYKLEKNDIVDIKVGAGGTGGQKVAAKGAVGGNSSVVVGGKSYVLAYGGGAGSRNAYGVDGGSGSGGGAYKTTAVKYTGGTALDAECAEGVLFAESFGHAGGSNGNSAYCSGGGGGAMGVGGDGSGAKGGAGGAGLGVDITGSRITYGSGGGGGGSGTKGSAGETAGVGGNTKNSAESATANCGGGGGGGGPNNNTTGYGGNGGSGIVVLRYALPTAVAQIGDTEYASLDAAIEAAGTQDEVVVVADIATDAAFEITKKVAINLNGKTIATTEMDTEGNGVFWVKSGGELTLNGEGTINGVGGNAYNIAIWADGGKATINGGTYTNVGAQDPGPDGAHFDLIYAKNGGLVEINGGTFKCETPNWTLNSHDTKKGAIVVKGGTFYGFNPANCTTEGANTNFCADGLCGYVVETVDGVDVYGVATAIAMVGDEMYPSFDAALRVAASGDTVKLLADVVVEKVVVVPNGAMLDLNGNTIQATAVVGKLAMNGGALKTWDANTGTYFFMAAPAGTAALYWTSDTVMTIGADYALSLDGGSVTLPNSWRSLLKQTLTIKSGATFVIPHGVELNLRGNAVVEEGATLTCEGTIALGNTYDAVDTSATLAGVELGAGKVTSAVEGYKAQYADGKYTLIKEGNTLTIADPSVTVQTQEAANAVTLNVVAPEGLTDAQKEAYLNYFEKKITPEGSGFKVELALVDAVKPVIAETEGDATKEALVIDAKGNVTLNISNKKLGLYYGVQVLAELGADPVAVVPETNGSLHVPAENLPDGNAAFFKVVVDFAPIVVSEAE